MEAQLVSWHSPSNICLLLAFHFDTSQTSLRLQFLIACFTNLAQFPNLHRLQYMYVFTYDW